MAIFPDDFEIIRPNLVTRWKMIDFSLAKNVEIKRNKLAFKGKGELKKMYKALIVEQVKIFLAEEKLKERFPKLRIQYLWEPSANNSRKFKFVAVVWMEKGTGGTPGDAKTPTTPAQQPPPP